MVENLKIWLDTKQYYANFDKSTIKPSVKYFELPDIDLKPKYEHTNIHLYNLDMIDVAIKLKNAGKNPLLLNMADIDEAGGCVDLGSSAQEEQCFRRSN